MLSSKEMAAIYKDIVKCFRNTWLLSPKDTIDAALKLHSFSDVAETFAALGKMKERNGGINGENREWLNGIPVAEECYDRQDPKYRDSEFLQCDLDVISPASINQIVTALRKMEKMGEAEKAEGENKPANAPKYYNEKAKEWSKKYIKERQRTVIIRFKREDFENRIAPAMNKAGLPMATFIKKAIDEKIERDRL